MATTYNPRIVTNGLVLCLDAANPQSYPGSGTTWTDLSGNGNHGTLTNGPTFSSANKGSIVFDGTNDIVTFPNNTISTSAGITVDVWFKTSSGIKYQDIFDLADAYGVWITTNISSVGTGKITASFNTLTGIMSANYSIDTWYQVVISGSGTTNTLYLNGVSVSTASQTVATSINLNTARIGNVDGDRAAEYFVGNVASLKLYNRALSAAEIAQNYNALKSRFIAPTIVTDGLVLHLDAGNGQSYPGSGTTWTDLSGNGNNGTLTNGPTFSSTNGGSIVFDGVDDYVQCTGSYTSTEFTFTAWIRRNGNQVNYAGILFSRGATVTGINYFGISNQLGYHWNAAASSYNWGSGLVLPDQTWCMVAVSVNSSSAVAYLCQASGITSATNNISHTSTTINDIKVSTDDEGNRYANQSVAVASIYNRALSAAEIAQNFNAIRERFGV